MNLEIKKRILKVAIAIQKLAGSYDIQISDKEMESLRFLAHRYDSAKTLYDGLELVDEEKGFYTIPEHVLWDTYEATKEDGGGEGIIPNLGGALGKKVNHLFSSMV